MANKTAAFLDNITAVAESRNRDYDDKGRPITSPKGARFAMQVMPATARTPGFGLRPADPNNAADMNRLGREYRAKMEERYGGDPAKMWAAYNAGPGRVDAAIASHGSNWLQAMPDETKSYVRNNMGKLKGGKGASAGTGEFLSGLESALGPEAKASQNVTQASDAIFNSGEKLDSRGQAVENVLTQQGAQLDVLDQTMQVAQAAATEAMTRQVEETRDINRVMTEGNQELRRQVTPVFAAKGRVQDQLQKLATINPLERGIRAIFDLNYDQGHLENQLKDFDNVLQSRAADYDYLNKLHQDAMQFTEQRYKLDTALPGLMQAQAQEDYGLLGMKLSQTSAMLDSAWGEVTRQSQLIAAQQSAKGVLLTQLDVQTKTGLMQQAEAAGGTVEFNGVPFTYKELRTNLQNEEANQYDMEMARMAIANGREEFAEKAAERVASRLSRTELEGVIQNGGKYGDMMIPVDIASAQLRDRIATDETRANAVLNEVPAKVGVQAATTHMQMVTGLTQRMKGLFGASGLEGVSVYTTRAGEIVRRISQAVNDGSPPEVIAALTLQAEQNSAALSKFAEERILSQVGGDKRAAGYMKAFVYGQRLDPAVAAEAMTYFAAKGNLPTGMVLSPELKALFTRAQQHINWFRTNKRADGKAYTTEQIMQNAQRRLIEDAPRFVTQERVNTVLASAPTLARNTRHPFGGFNQARWNQLQADAERQAVVAVAKQAKTTPENVAQIYKTGKPLGNSEADQRLFQAVNGAKGIYNATESTTLMRLLDGEKWIKPGVPNSELYADFLGSPNLATGVEDYHRSLGQSSLGEYLSNPLTSSGINGAFQVVKRETLKGISANRENDISYTRDPMLHRLLQPVARTKMILESIPGVGREGAARMSPLIQGFFDQWMQKNAMRGITPNDQFINQDSAFYNFLQTQKFADPQFETFRKAALKGWETHATEQKNVLLRIFEATQMNLTGAGGEVLAQGEYDLDGNRR